jgi:hypothetical protein
MRVVAPANDPAPPSWRRSLLRTLLLCTFYAGPLALLSLRLWREMQQGMLIRFAVVGLISLLLSRWAARAFDARR